MNESVTVESGNETRFVETLDMFKEFRRSLGDRVAAAPERKAVEALDAVLALVSPHDHAARRLDMGGFASFRASLEMAAEASPELRALRLFDLAFEQLQASAGTDALAINAETAEAEAEAEAETEAEDVAEAEAETETEGEAEAEAEAETEEAEAEAEAETEEAEAEAEAEAEEEAAGDDQEPSVGDDDQAAVEPGDQGDGAEAVERTDDEMLPAEEAELEGSPEGDADGAETESVEQLADTEAPRSDAPGNTAELADFRSYEAIDPETGEIRRRIAELEDELASVRAQLAA